MKTDIDPFAYIDAMIFLIRHRIPYNEWPDELKIAGLTLDFYPLTRENPVLQHWDESRLF